jgi:phenylpropionate dioxygenase-like ring-hydroxylating dioxygenase large terminal subunit
MLVTRQPVLRRFWYPVMPISELQSKPASFTLLGQPLALWLDAEGKPAAVIDRCCHRFTKLSIGEVIDGCLRCAYHGWLFNSQGACVEVPQLGDQPIPKGYQVQAYRCQERYGYVWVCLEEPLADIPEIAEVSDRQFRQLHEFYESWKCSGLSVMENSFDNAHFSFVHAQTFGNQQQPIPAAIETETSEFGLEVKTVVPVVNPPLQQKNLGIQAATTFRTNVMTWYLPFVRKLHITYPNGLIHIIVTAATPIDDSTSQIVQFCLRNDTEADAKASDIISFDRAVTLEDKAVLEATDSDTPLSILEQQHMASDKPGIIMRHKFAALLRKHGEIEQRRSQ